MLSSSMIFRMVAFILLFCARTYAHVYPLTNEPLDVVIPCVGKDLETLEMCIAGVKKNCAVRNIYIVSEKNFTDSAIWFDEANFPFTKEDIAFCLCKDDPPKTDEYLSDTQNRTGWYYQQLLKFYAPYVIPNISSNILILDSDTIILNPVEFMNKNSGGLYNFTYKVHKQYFEHAKRLLGDSIDNPFPQYSAITHHMVFQRQVLDAIFSFVEALHQEPFWKAFCHCVDQEHLFAGASEYEIYFNFVFSHTNQMNIHYLSWREISNLEKVSKFRKKGFHYVTCHSHRREKK